MILIKPHRNLSVQLLKKEYNPTVQKGSLLPYDAAFSKMQSEENTEHKTKVEMEAIRIG